MQVIIIIIRRCGGQRQTDSNGHNHNILILFFRVCWLDRRYVSCFWSPPPYGNEANAKHKKRAGAGNKISDGKFAGQTTEIQNEAQQVHVIYGPWLLAIPGAKRYEYMKLY